MKALAIMQNQWLHNAAYHQTRQDAMRANNEPLWWHVRERAVPFALFRGCKSGQVLKRHLGDVTEEIIWEEASTRIGATASSCPPADPAHIRAILDKYVPPIVITFGKIASEAVNAVLDPGFDSRRTYKDHALTFIQAPHPAARNPDLQESVREACVALLNAIGRY